MKKKEKKQSMDEILEIIGRTSMPTSSSSLMQSGGFANRYFRLLARKENKRKLVSWAIRFKNKISNYERKSWNMPQSETS